MDLSSLNLQEVYEKLKKYWDRWSKVPAGAFPPKVKFTLSDPTYDVPPVFDETDGQYVYAKDGEVVPVLDSNWKTVLSSIPIGSSRQRKAVYRGSIWGDAAILGLNNTSKQYVNLFISSPENSTPETALKEVHFTIPKDVVSIYISYYKPNAEPYELIIGGFYSEIDVTRYIPGDLDLEVTLLRDKFETTQSEVSFPIEFNRLAKDFIAEVVKRNGAMTHLQFNIYERNPIHLNEYTLLRTTQLDISTIEISDDIVQISSYNADFNDFANSNGRQKYDIPVRDVQAIKKWNYDRINMECSGNYTIPSPYEQRKTLDIRTNFAPQVFLNKSEQVPGGSEHDILTQAEGFNLIFNSDTPYFFEAYRRISLNFILKAGFRLLLYNTVQKEPKVKIIAYNTEKNEQITVFERSFTFDYMSGIDSYYYIDLDTKVGIEIDEGYRLVFLMSDLDTGGEWGRARFGCDRFETFKIRYTDNGPAIKNIALIDPQKLLQHLIDRISAFDMFKASIEWRETDYKTLLCAAESIRNYEKAMLHTSFYDFKDWMNAFGYELDYNYYTKEVKFIDRDRCFDPSVTALELERDNQNTLIEAAEEDFFYTGVSVGYDKQDYESTNGKYEPMGTFDYQTGYVGDNNILKIISPYRADSIGIELLFWERETQSTDTKSDNDIFCVAFTENEDHYSVYEGMKTTVGESIKIFNTPFLPYYMIKYNESKIGIITEKIYFTGTTGYREAELSDGLNIYEDILIRKKLFEPFVYDFEYSNKKRLPFGTGRNGLIRFNYKGRIIEGFIKQIRQNFNLPTATTWVLYKYK